MIVVEEHGAFQLVQMPAQIVATVRTAGSLAWAPNQAFGILAGYIFGENTKRDQIAMTAPVTSEAVDGEKIAMTAPVINQEVATGVYETAFIMPSKRTLDTLPEPVHDQIEIKKLAATTKAVWRFGGRATDRRVRDERDQFMDVLEKSGITRTKWPTLAQYNDPWTPPWMRRNELWVSIE